MSEEQLPEIEEKISYFEDLTLLIDSLIDSPSLDQIIPNKCKVAAYKTMSSQARILYLRLYLRKRHWLRQSTFSYTDVGDVDSTTEELLEHRYLVALKDDSEKMTVNDLLGSMSAKEVKDLCVYFNLKRSGPMRSMQSAILGMCKGQTSLFGGVASTEKRVKSKCIEKLSDMVKISEGLANVFDKMLIASFPQYLSTYEDDDKGAYTGKGNLSQILLSHYGLNSKYPSYNINFSESLFKSSQQLDVFLEACQLDSVCYTHTTNSKWGDLKNVYLDNITRYEASVGAWGAGTELAYLQQYTEEWVMTRVMRHCLAALLRLKEYKAAASLLRTLLKCRPVTHRRGSWWESLALIQDYHLKDKVGAMETARLGLDDPDTTHGSRLALQIRLNKLSPNYTLTSPFQPKEVTIDIVAIEGSGSAANSKKIYLCVEEEGSVLCGVEDAALNYYIKNNNFREGLHCEGGIISTLFAILCWDLIFSDLDNVFFNKYQYHPLDFWSVDFFARRKELFQGHFAMLKCLSEESMNDFITESWTKHSKHGCAGLSWELFSGKEQCQRCVSCITPPILVGIFEEYIKDIRLKRSGMPDLSIWNFESRVFMMVEVKGPGDSLRNNQKVWLSLLDRIEARAEVCHVRAVSSKKIT